MSTDAEVWLGELARSLARLRPRDHGTAAAMARMLGFQTNESEDESGDRGSTEPRRSPSASPTSPAGDSDSDADESTEAQLAELPLLERGPPRPERRPLPWTTADPLPEVSERHLHERLPPEPLLEPRWGRELLLAAIAAEVADSSIDETAVVDMIARGEPLEVLPGSNAGLWCAVFSCSWTTGPEWSRSGATLARWHERSEPWWVPSRWRNSTLTPHSCWAFARLC